MRSIPTSMHSTILVFDIILFVLTFPFVVTSYHYSTHEPSCVWMRGSLIKVTLREWMLIDATVVLSFVVMLTLASLMYLITPRCLCFHSVHFYLAIALWLFRVAWLVVGGILFWKDLNKQCEGGYSKYMTGNLIIGYIYSVLYFIAGCLFPRPTIRVTRQTFQEILEMDPTLVPKNLSLKPKAIIK